MRPYVAVIADSFRSAFASRILWVALATIYVFLLALAPIGYQEVFTTRFTWLDFANGTRMKAMLARAIDEHSGAETPAGRIARRLPDELQRNLRKVAQGQEVRIHLHIFADGLNGLLESDDWYDRDVWRAAPQLRELRELEQLAPQELSEQLRQRRARLRIEAALPGVFENRGARSIALTYAGFPFPEVFPVEKAQFQLLLNHFALRLIIDWVLGFVMIFLGILVTAAIIPDMLQPGSLHLLLSKPVSRSLLFLAKFLGGCAFVFVCVSQLITGLWLIAGFRLDMWNGRLLWCIPVCVFLFAVFYSVSAVAGLRWRSPILAIGLANLFGAACLLIGFAGWLSDSFVTEGDRITGLTVSGEQLVASTRGGHLRRYDSSTNQWVNLFPDDPGRNDRVLPPVRLADGRIATARVRGGRVNLFGSGATPVLLLDPGPGGTLEPSIELPVGTSDLFAFADGGLLAVNSGDVMVAPAQVLHSPGANEETPGAPAESASDVDTGLASPEQPEQGSEAAAPGMAAGLQLGGWLPKLVKMMGGPSDGFVSVLPQRVTLVSPYSVAVSRDGTSLFVYSGGRLIRLDRDTRADWATEPRWSLVAQTETVTATQSVWLRVLGDRVVLLRSDEPPLIFDWSLQPQTPAEQVAETLAKLKVLSVVSCWAANAVAVLAGDGSVWLLSSDAEQQLAVERLGGTREVETLYWDESTRRLWVAHHIDRVSAWELVARGTSEVRSEHHHVLTYRPALRGWRWVDRYLVTPLRFVTPQTAELGETIATIVSGESTMQLPLASAGETTVQRYHVWRPVMTCGAFIVLMLAVGCAYFARTDF